jgi:hypothetical protein
VIADPAPHQAPMKHIVQTVHQQEKVFRQDVYLRSCNGDCRCSRSPRPRTRPHKLGLQTPGRDPSSGTRSVPRARCRKQVVAVDDMAGRKWQSLHLPGTFQCSGRCLTLTGSWAGQRPWQDRRGLARSSSAEVP